MIFHSCWPAAFEATRFYNVSENSPLARELCDGPTCNEVESSASQWVGKLHQSQADFLEKGSLQTYFPGVQNSQLYLEKCSIALSVLVEVLQRFVG